MSKPTARKRANGAPPTPSNGSRKPTPHTPKSMVIRTGGSEVGLSISQLVTDFRRMMEPNTATRLKERRSNKLRDYTTMAGSLGVPHLLLFSRSNKRGSGSGSGSGNVNMRLCATPRGPTLHFRVEKYSLCKDVYRSQKRPKAGGNDLFLGSPLLVMNNFLQSQQQERSGDGDQQHIPKHLESLTTTIFQSLFPPINPTTTPLRSIKRVLLLDRLPSSSSSSQASYVLNLRHYAIETRTAKSIPKPLRRLDAAEKLTHNKRKRGGGLPNLGRLDDVADYFLDPQAAAAESFTSGSESEPETDAEVEVLAPTTTKGQDRRRHASKTSSSYDSEAPDRRQRSSGPTTEKKAIKLHELGPRLRLRLTKVEEGLCTGKVMWHEYFQKSEAEVREMERVHEQKRAEKERRKAEQRANVERKKAKGEDVADEDEGMEDVEDVWQDDDDEDMDHGAADEVHTGSDEEEEDVT